MPKFNPRWALDRMPPPAAASELDGYVGAGMKKEALRLVRRLLKAPTVAAPTFAEAVHAILILADKVKLWKALVESAYARIPKRKRGLVRFWIMSVRNVCDDAEGVLQLIPKRFTGKWALLELIWAVEATFATGRDELMNTLASRLLRIVDKAQDPPTQALLSLCLAELFARWGAWAWDDAIGMANEAQECSAFLQRAVGTTVDIHVARALKAVRWGFIKIKLLRRQFDPEVELTIPGNESAMLDDAAKKFERLQKMLERILPKERQKELGLD